MLDSRDRVLIHRYKKRYLNLIKLHGEAKARCIIANKIREIIAKREVALDAEVDQKVKSDS